MAINSLSQHLQNPDQMEHVDEKKNMSAAGPVVIGLYGLPASGKTTLMHRLKQKLPEKSFLFFEGSEVLGSLVDGGIDAFRSLDSAEQVVLRQRQLRKSKENAYGWAARASLRGI